MLKTLKVKEQDSAGNWLPDICILLVVFIWGVNMPVMKFALGRMDEFLFNAIRLTLSAITLGLVVWWQSSTAGKRLAGFRLDKRKWIELGLFSLVVGFIYQLVFLLGINATSAGNTAIIMSSVPIWTAVLSLFLIRQRLNKWSWVGLIIAFTGTIVVVINLDLPSGASPSSSSSMLGNLIVSGGAILWAIGSVWSKTMFEWISPVALACLSIALVLPLHYFTVAFSLSEAIDIFQDGWLIAAIVFSGIFSTGIAIALWNFSVQQLGPAHAAGYQNLIPLIAILFSWVLVGEIPNAYQVAGGVLLVFGLVVMQNHRTH